MRYYNSLYRSSHALLTTLLSLPPKDGHDINIMNFSFDFLYVAKRT